MGPLGAGGGCKDGFHPAGWIFGWSWDITSLMMLSGGALTGTPGGIFGFAATPPTIGR